MSDSGRRRTVIILSLVVVAAGAWATARRFVRPTAAPLTQISVIPENVSQIDSAWYWIERPDKAKMRLIRFSNSKSETIVEADEISGYSVSGDKIAWSDRVDKIWRVMSGPLSGQKSQMWSGADIAGQPCFDGERVLWTTAHAGPLNEISYLPGLGPTVSVCVAGQGSSSTVIATLPEPDGRLLAAQGGAVYVSARDNTVVYKVGLNDGKYKRLVSEATMSKPVMDKSGTVFWVAGSKDTANLTLVASVNSLSPGGNASTNMDWVPFGGVIYPTSSGNYYIDGAGQSAVWPITGRDRLPTPASLPLGYLPVGVGEHSVLLMPARYSKGQVPLFTAPLP